MMMTMSMMHVGHSVFVLFSFCFGFLFPFRCSSDEESPLFGSSNVGGRAGGARRGGPGRAGKGLPRSKVPALFFLFPL